MRRSYDQILDEINRDVLLNAHGVVDPGRARSIVESWLEYLNKHRDEISAMQILDEAQAGAFRSSRSRNLPIA